MAVNASSAEGKEEDQEEQGFSLPGPPRASPWKSRGKNPLNEQGLPEETRKRKDKIRQGNRKPFSVEELLNLGFWGLSQNCQGNRPNGPNIVIFREAGSHFSPRGFSSVSRRFYNGKSSSWERTQQGDPHKHVRGKFGIPNG